MLTFSASYRKRQLRFQENCNLHNVNLQEHGYRGESSKARKIVEQVWFYFDTQAQNSLEGHGYGVSRNLVRGDVFDLMISKIILG